MKESILIFVFVFFTIACSHNTSDKHVVDSNDSLGFSKRAKDSIQYESINVKENIFLDSINLESAAESKRTIIVVYGCDNPEILSDLDYSIDNNKKNFEKYSIKVQYLEDSTYCGYILKNDSIQKEIKTVKTDVDLLYEAKGFFFR